MGRVTRWVLLAPVAVAAVIAVASSAGVSAASPAPTAGTISAGQNHTCGVRTDQTVACWGDNATGQATPPAGTFSQVSAGYFHSCGLKTDHTIACWGDNGAGQSAAPAGNFSQVSSGGFHSCGVQTDGTLKCWGDDSLGQAGAPAGTFSQVSAGGFHTCALSTGGTVACWGFNRFGQATPPAATFTQVSSGANHTCGVQTDGTVACWGYNFFGQATPPAGTFSEVSSGGNHTCGLHLDGTIACWGYNFFGQATPPTGTFSEVSSGGNHTCAVSTTDGTAVCWGDDSSGQATAPSGTFTPAADTTPPVITVPANITAEATGPSGAAVTYSVTATDPDDAATVSCSPASGATFPLGATTVICSATDTHGNTSSATFTITVNDTTPPAVTISVTSPVEATGPSGATVVYAAAATDTVSGSLTPSCTPVSGSTFPLGSTTINCSATDAAGNTGSATATVVVEDKTAPTLSLPADVATNATSPSGAVVTFAVSATDPDNLMSDLAVSCSPPSGSTFPIGATTVTCSATDPAGNTSTGSFHVNVMDFSLSPIPSVTVVVGGTASTAVTVNSLGGFNSAVALGASGAPAGVSLTISPSSVTPSSGGSSISTLTVQLSPMVTPATFTLTVAGTSGSLVHSSAVAVTVTVSSAGISSAIGQMLATGCIDNAGIANALTAKLTAAQAAIGGGNSKTATNILSAFIDQVRAQTGKHIPSACTVGGVTFDPSMVLTIDARSLIDSLAISATPNPIVGSVETSTGLGVSGATLTLKDSTGATLATATTDITGFYFFATTGLLTPGGTYTVTVTVPAGLTAATPAVQTFTWTGGAEVSLAAFTAT